MKNESLTDEEVLVLCRTPQQTKTNMLKGIQWAIEKPSAHKIQPLLILQTDNRASMQYLHSEFHEAIHLCAKIDPNPLWHTIENDWETYRIWHAILALIQLKERKTLRRLVELGETPLMNIRWSKIRQTATLRLMRIPKNVLEIQDALNVIHPLSEDRNWIVFPPVEHLSGQLRVYLSLSSWDRIVGSLQVQIL